MLDEEHSEGARVTMEREGRNVPWAVTCGIYGAFMHTAFASSEGEARSKYDAIKGELVVIMNEVVRDSRYQRMKKISEMY